MRIAVGLADAHGRSCELGTDATTIWSRTAAALDPAADHTEIARWLQQPR